MSGQIIGPIGVLPSAVAVPFQADEELIQPLAMVPR